MLLRGLSCPQNVEEIVQQPGLCQVYRDWQFALDFQSRDSHSRETAVNLTRPGNFDFERSHFVLLFGAGLSFHRLGK